ncbi:hypothetical protein HG263_21230 [Pseudoalteromonas sp. JBTF-M23]|uniref:Uncharacterized protein n=1 Tax=Pseudoalteromonas caenipelagi TaxID=2726988 RepID=A0A849VK55_9GAMM|nr:hypothetical protein [Pseudoalteromonas caenipelagi]NOU53028.1 hypothetical protein [Pseudoalteromonas caenipelagi]
MFKLSQALILTLCLASCNQVNSQSKDQTQPESVNSKAQPVAAAASINEQHKANASPAKPSQPILDEVSLQDIEQLHNQLKTLTQDVSCDTTMQCQVEAVGSRACGGPSSYIVYSNKSANPDTIKQIASKITLFESTYNAKNKMMSICQHLTKPSTQCVENKCVKLTNTSQETF